MKPGIIRIIIGTIMLVLQTLAIIGNSQNGHPLTISFSNPAIFLYDLIVLLSFCFVGIVGVICFVSGLIANIRSKHVSVNVSSEAKQTTKQYSKKTRYCKECGSLVDNNTKKCTGCGKQYFKGIRVSKAAVTIILLVFLLGYSIYGNLSQITLNSELRAKNAELQAQIETLHDTIEKQSTQSQKSANTISSQDAELLDEFKNYVVICDLNDKLYHSPDCSALIRIQRKYVNAEYFYTDIDRISQYGCAPCPDCRSEQKELTEKQKKIREKANKLEEEMDSKYGTKNP